MKNAINATFTLLGFRFGDPLPAAVEAGKNVLMGKPIITQTNAPDHLPVTCDVTIQ
jgi:hypothetical protein